MAYKRNTVYRFAKSRSALRGVALGEAIGSNQANDERIDADDRETAVSADSIAHIPERRENWAEAEFRGGAKSIITLKSGHVLLADEPPGFAGGTGGENAGPTPTGFLVAAFAADIPAILNRIAREQGIEISALSARVEIAWNPRGIAGAEGIEPTPFEAVSDIRIETTADGEAIERMRAAYERRCPLYNLFRKAGCRMLDRWQVDPPRS